MSLSSLWTVVRLWVQTYLTERFLDRDAEVPEVPEVPEVVSLDAWGCCNSCL